MSKGLCPFLSTEEEKIKCFKECVFYKCKDFDGECPFKQLDMEMNFYSTREKYDYDILANDESSPVSLLYK